MIDGFGGSVAVEIGTWVGSIAGAVYGVNRLWRALGRSRVEGRKDAAEINMLSELQKENAILRERADMFARERNEAMSELGLLRGQVASLRQQVEDLRVQIEIMQRRQNGHAAR